MKTTSFGVYLEKIVKQEDGFKAYANIDFKANPSDGNYISFDSKKFTFRNKPQVGTEIQIGSTAEETLQNLLANKELPTDVTFKREGSNLKITYNKIGDAGNTWTIESDFLSVPKTLSGGSNNPDPDWKQIDGEVNYKLRELPILDGSTNTVLFTSKDITGKQILSLDESNKIEKKFMLEKKAIEKIGTTDTLNIFGDGSCIATYTFDGDANDLGGKYNGKWTGTANYSDGKYGKAASFNGNSALNFGKPYANGVLNENTVSFWRKANSDDFSKWGFIFGAGNDSNGHLDWYEFGEGENQGELSVYVSKETGKWGDELTIKDFFLYDNNWHFYSVSIDKKGKYEVYRDGKLFNSYSYAPILYKGDDAGDLQIGKRYDGGWKYLKGLIDQVRLFNRPLTDEEINALYNEKIQILKYDISQLNFSKTPSKLFLASIPSLEVQCEETDDRMLPTILEEKVEIISQETDDKNLSVATKLLDGEIIVADGVEIGKDGVKEESDTTNTLDIFGDNSCIAAYTFDENVKDLSGNYNGTKNNVTYSNGKFGKALNTGWATFSNSDMFQGQNFNRTISFWAFHKPSNNTELLFEFAKAGTDNHRFYLMKREDNKFYFNIETTETSFILEENKWSFVTISTREDRSGVNIFVNKKLISSGKSFSAYDFSDAFSHIIGASSDSNERREYTGLIDQVRIFNRALTEKEIEKLYYEQKTILDLTKLNFTSIPTSVYKKGSLEITKVTSTLDSFTGELVNTFNFKKGDKVITDKGIVTLTDVPKIEDISLVDNPNPFGDNSQIAGYTFDNDKNGVVIEMNGKYNGQWKDKDGNNISGTYEKGKFGKAGVFDQNVYLAIPEVSTKLPMTISLSFKTSQKVIGTYGWTHPTLIGFATDGSGSNDFGIEVNNGYLHIFSGFGEEKYITSSKFVSDNEWHQISVIFDTNKCSVYCDKELVLSFSQNSTKIDSVKNWFFGRMYNYPANSFMSKSQFEGLIDQVRIFNRALTEEEIQALYKEEAKKYTLPLPKQDTAYQWCGIPNRAKTLQILDTQFNGEKFTTKFKQTDISGRRAQRRLILQDEIEVIPPFTSNMWKGE